MDIDPEPTPVPIKAPAYDRKQQQQLRPHNSFEDLYAMKMDNGSITVQVQTASLQRMKEALIKIFSVKNIRGLALFFGFGEAKPFNIPGKETIATRARKNVLFFATNYAICACLVAVLALLLNPFFLFVLICLGGFWMYVASAAANETPENPMKVFGKPISPKQRQIGMTIISAVVIILFGGSILLTITTFSVFLAGAHALLRDCPQIREEDELGFLSDEGIKLPSPIEKV